MKDHAYLFAHELEAASCLSLRLDSSGLINAPLNRRNWSELAQWQEKARFTLVLPAQQFSFHRVELPLLSDKKAREALPFALEHQLADDIANLHFAFDKQYYQAGHYLVAVCQRKYIEELFELLHQHHLSIHKTTADCFALPLHEKWCIAQGLLINQDPHFLGFLNPLMLPADQQALLLDDAQTHSLQDKEIFYQRIATQLNKQPGMNLFRSTTQQSVQGWFQRAALMGGLCLLVFLLTHGVRLYQFNNQSKIIDEQIALLYHQLFPQSTQIINPRFRVTQLMKTSQQDSALWLLLNKLSENIAKQIKIKRLRFENDKLQVSFLAPSFSSLESFTQHLQGAHLQVKQEQAHSIGTGVEAVLELSL